MRKTRGGDLLLSVQGGAAKANSLKQRSTAETGSRVESTERGKGVIIADLDASTEAAEVAAKISVALGGLIKETLEVKNIRVERSENKSAEVFLSKVWADRLLEMGRVKIFKSRIDLIMNEVD